MAREAICVTGRVESTRVAVTLGSIATTAVDEIKVHVGSGIKNDSHADERLLDVREKELLSHGLLKGMPIANVRQFSAVSVEELLKIQSDMGLSELPYGLLGENLVVSGIPNFSKLPPGTLLLFSGKNQVNRTAVLAVWGENEPCVVAANSIQDHFPELPRIGLKFPKAAVGRRGIVGFVYSSGVIKTCDMVEAILPKTSDYQPA